MAIRFAKLTRKAVGALQVGQRIAEHGITVTRTATGDLIYRVSVMVDGQRVHRTIGRESEGVTREQAERAIETFRTKAREGRLDLPTGRKTHRTFAEAATEYLQRMEDTAGKNMPSKRYHIPSILIPHFGKLRADRVSTFDIEKFVATRLDGGVRQATVNRELATLSHFFRRAVRWGWINPGDCPELVKGSEPRKKIFILDDQDADRLMEAAAADSEQRLHLFIAFGLNAAMRHGEILRVRYDQLDFATNRIFIPIAKAGQREQPITPTLAALIKTQRDKDGANAIWLFPSTVMNGPYPHRVTLAKQFKRAVERAGLQPSAVTPHVMRHTAITRLVKAGIDLPTVQRISGHKTLTMVLRYVHIHGAHIDAALTTIDTTKRRITHELHTRASVLQSGIAPS